MRKRGEQSFWLAVPLQRMVREDSEGSLSLQTQAETMKGWGPKMGKMVLMGLERAGYTQSRLRVSGGGPLGSSSRLRMPDGMYMVIGRPRRNIFTEMPSTEKRGCHQHPAASLQESQSRTLPTKPRKYPQSSSRGSSPNPNYFIQILPDASVLTQIVIAPPRSRTPRTGEGVFPPTAVGKEKSTGVGVRSQDLSVEGRTKEGGYSGDHSHPCRLQFAFWAFRAAG